MNKPYDRCDMDDDLSMIFITIRILDFCKLIIENEVMSNE